MDSDIISDSSGVGTANSDTTSGSISMPGTTVVCVEAYKAQEEGHISISLGDIIESKSFLCVLGFLVIFMNCLVTGATDDGFLEGILKSGSNRVNGLFPVNCVQEVRLRHHHNIQTPMMVARDRQNGTSNGNRSDGGRVLGRRESTSKHFATAPRVKKNFNQIG